MVHSFSVTQKSVHSQTTHLHFQLYHHCGVLWFQSVIVPMAISYVQAIPGIVLVVILAFFLQIFIFSPISPLMVNHRSHDMPLNHELTKITKLGEGILDGPEDVSVGENGVLYVATSDGWVRKLYRDGTFEKWKYTGSSLMLGTTYSNGSLIICDVKQGLLKVDDNGVSVLVSHKNFSHYKGWLVDEVAAASDGTLYFSVATTKYEVKHWYLDIIEGRPTGQLVKYEPKTNKATILLDKLGFANGVAVSKEEDYVFVCETYRYRILKYWLKGEKAGQTEIFIDNLPGAPDNVYFSTDGSSVWVALIKLLADRYEFVHESKIAKHVIATYPSLIRRVNGAFTRAMVANIGLDGKINKILTDPDGQVISFVTSCVEFEDHLYLGGLHNTFIGKYSLKDA